jgi:outer membrane protein TolC
VKTIGTTRLLLPVLALLLAGPASGLAQPDAAGVPPGEVLELSVEEVALLALQHNRDLQVRRLTPVIAGTFEQIERGAFDPEVFAELNYAEERASETARATGTQFEVEGNEAAAVAGIRTLLPTGTTLEGTLEQFRSISNRAPEQQVARLGLTVTQALLQGFGPAVNLAAVRQAELGTVASRFELRAFTEALLAEAETAYWNFVLAREEIAIFESSLEVARRQRDETELRIEVGLLPEVEAAAARAEVALREQALIDARSLLEERRLRLLRLLNPDHGNSFDQRILATTEPRMEPTPVQDLPERLQLAEKMRPELGEARMLLEQQRLETVVTRNGLLPRLDFFITLGKTGYADSFSGSFHELDGKTYDLRTGLRLNRALGNRAAEARHLAARTSRQQAQESVANLQQLVRLDVRLAVNDLERVRQQISASAVTRALQEETLAAERERFDVGASTTLLVSQAQRDLLASQIAEVEAIVNYRIALVNLFLAEGALIERRGISM